MVTIITQTVNVELSTGKVIPTAFVHQNDTSRTIIFKVTSNGIPWDMSDYDIKFAYKSPIVDGQYSVIAGNSMVNGEVESEQTSWVYFTPTIDYTRISGVGMLTMIITPSSGTVRPVNIRLVVQKSADGDDVIAGASDFIPVLEQYMSENMAEYIDAWLVDHPEATTTVQDHSLTMDKAIIGSFGYVTPQNYGATGDGETDDTAAFEACFASGETILIPAGEYLINAPVIANCNVVEDDGTYPNIKPIYPHKAPINSPYDYGKVKNYSLSDASSYTEGCCYNTKTGKLIVGARIYSTTPNTTNLYIINPDTYEIENTYSYNFSVVNSMSYNATTNKILVCCFPGSGSTTYGVHVINGDTMADEGTMTTPNNHYYFAYNSECHVWVSSLRSSGQYIFTVYDDNFTLLKTITIPTTDNAQQGVDTFGSKIYQSGWNSITVVDIASEEVDIIELAGMQELEDLCFVNEERGFLCAHTLAMEPRESLYEFNANVSPSFSYGNEQSRVQGRENIPINTITINGVYRVAVDDSVPLSTASSSYGFPFGTRKGTLICRASNTETLDIIAATQIFIADEVVCGFVPMYTRKLIGSNKPSDWKAWVQVTQKQNLLRDASNATTNKVLTVAKLLPFGTWTFSMTVASDRSELPANDTKWHYASGEIIVRDSGLTNTDACIKVILYSATNSDVAYNTCWNGNWTGWTVK